VQETEGGEIVKIEDFPPHECGLFLTHNEHRNNYETIEEWASDRFRSWVSPEERAKAIETNEAWELQWYPNTPVGFLVVTGATLESVLKAAREAKS
jgi:hypothetical protein